MDAYGSISPDSGPAVLGGDHVRFVLAPRHVFEVVFVGASLRIFNTPDAAARAQLAMGKPRNCKETGD